MLSLNLILIALGVTQAPSHNNVPMSRPSQTWYHPSDHPVQVMFKRATNNDTDSYLPVGSTEWLNSYPPPWITPNSSTLPTSLINALNSAVAAGKIPNIPTSYFTAPGTSPVYPKGIDPTSPKVCSGTDQCMIEGDIWAGPDGTFASAFDDGPTDYTPVLVQFLQNNNKTTTHFMIGSNIFLYPKEFLTAFDAGHDIAIHTWTHPYMTNKTNLEVLSELYWTMKIIIDSTKGLVPQIWRPPYGDTDCRVSAIAKEVFNLTTVVWNEDQDWRQNTTAPIVTNLQNFLSGPKAPGLIVLTHELRNVTVYGFIIAFDLIAKYQWIFESLAQALGKPASYSNPLDSPTKDVIPKPVVSPVSSTSKSSSSNTASPSNTITSKANPSSRPSSNGTEQKALSVSSTSKNSSSNTASPSKTIMANAKSSSLSSSNVTKQKTSSTSSTSKSSSSNTSSPSKTIMANANSSSGPSSNGTTPSVSSTSKSSSSNAASPSKSIAAEANLSSPPPLAIFKQNQKPQPTVSSTWSRSSASL